jgi:CheY-like chemotaxis protein/HPt (histidine-containing phosphotransfer) domain-containing protein
VQRVLRRYLEHLGLSTEIVTDAVSLARRLADREDAMLARVVLVHADFPDIADVLQGLPAGLRSRAVIVGEPVTDERAGGPPDDGRTVHLGQPFTVGMLREAIASALDLHGGDDAVVAGEAAREPDDALRGARLLVVEDDPVSRELAVELLAEMGVAAQAVCNGREALEALDSDAFDGVLMDCQMPVMDGYQATERLRRDPRFSGLPVIALTANVMSSYRDRALRAGMNDLVGKPIDQRLLVETLRRWIRPAVPDRRGGEAGRVVAETGGDALPELDGIDVEAGLARVRGKVATYRKLLGMFRESQSDFETKFQAARGAGDDESAVRLAHSLKGSAGAIGATGLMAAAAELEAACRNPEAPVDDALAGVCDELARIMAALALV